WSSDVCSSDLDIRLRVVIDAVVERVLFSEKRYSCCKIIVNSVVVDGNHIAASTQPPVTGAANQHGVYIFVVFEFREGLIYQPDHVVRECIYRIRPVERHKTQPALNGYYKFIL